MYNIGMCARRKANVYIYKYCIHTRTFTLRGAHILMFIYECVPLAKRKYVYIQRIAEGCSMLGGGGGGERERDHFGTLHPFAYALNFNQT
jgi:hypothetical protein